MKFLMDLQCFAEAEGGDGVEVSDVEAVAGDVSENEAGEESGVAAGNEPEKESEDAGRQRWYSALFSRWRGQAALAQQQFPELDLNAEMADARFVGLLMNGVDVGTAYVAVHHDSLIPAALRAAAGSAEEKIVRSIASGAARPRENAAGGSAAVNPSVDVSRLTKQEMESYMERVRNGERISFG